MEKNTEAPAPAPDGAMKFMQDAMAVVRRVTGTEDPLTRAKRKVEEGKTLELEEWDALQAAENKTPKPPTPTSPSPPAEVLPPQDAVNHPAHYTAHPSGVECIDITEHMNFNLGNAVKYIWRWERKNGMEDLLKARWYLNREIQRLEKTEKKG